MVKKFLITFSILLALVSCGTGGKTYRIGVDPSWYPLNVQGKEVNIFAFSNELLAAISHEEGVFFERVRMSWDDLTLGLKEEKYEAMLSSMTPRRSLESQYVFSDPFLSTGPVLVISAQKKMGGMEQMKEKEVAVDSYANEALLIRNYPGVIVQYYDSIPEGFDEVISERLDGMLVNYIEATSFLRDLYSGKVKIATPPLDDAGLRLITLQNDNKEIVDIFNHGLEKLRSNGKLDKLLKKWELN